MQHTTTLDASQAASTKPFYKSKTILGMLPVLLTLLAPLFGARISDAEMNEAVNALSALLSLALVVYGRRRAVTTITL